MFYLTYIHYSTARSFCDISETISCDVVTTSIYSEVFNVPLSILGLVYFTIVFLLVMFYKKKSLFQILFFFTLLVFIPSLYLTATEAFLIKSFCILCESSKVLMAVIGVVSLKVMRESISTIVRLSVPVIIAGLALSAITFFAQTGNTTRNDYSTFVEALNNKSVVYYKSFKCSNCKRQEMLFGKAYVKLNSVECHPDGPKADPQRCLRMKISRTPTFLIEKGGVELKRIEGLQKLETIASWAEVEFKDE